MRQNQREGAKTDGTLALVPFVMNRRSVAFSARVAEEENMTHTTDGKAYVFAVFDADGCECKNLAALFSTREGADRFAAQLRESAKQEFALFTQRRRDLGKHVDYREITVEMLELDAPDLESQRLTLELLGARD
jgi:hypothetical protein